MAEVNKERWKTWKLSRRQNLLPIELEEALLDVMVLEVERIGKKVERHPPQMFLTPCDLAI
jgi:hypothetical protein